MKPFSADVEDAVAWICLAGIAEMFFFLILLVVGRSVVGQGSLLRSCFHARKRISWCDLICLEATKEAENIAEKTVLKQTEH